MSIRASAWMKWVACLMLTLPVSGCVSGVSGEAICDATQEARTEHAAALANDGGPLSVKTGVRLIRLIDAGCGLM